MLLLSNVYVVYNDKIRFKMNINTYINKRYDRNN